MKLCLKHDEWMSLVLIINETTKRKNGVYWTCSRGCKIKVKLDELTPEELDGRERQAQASEGANK